MPNNIIKAGYRLTVNSWENDLDNFNTVIVDGMSKEQCAFSVDLCKALLQHSAISNLHGPTKRELLLVEEECKKIGEKHRVYLESIYDVEATDVLEDVFKDIIYDELYELSLSSGEFFTRVCSSYKVEYIPQDILIEDVTDKF